jgi:hypothetical protein
MNYFVLACSIICYCTGFIFLKDRKYYDGGKLRYMISMSTANKDANTVKKVSSQPEYNGKEQYRFVHPQVMFSRKLIPIIIFIKRND